MNTNNNQAGQEQNQDPSSRKKFLLWGLGILASVTALKTIISPKKKKQLVKMLSQDGKLVEVDKDFLTHKAQKVTNKELQGWIKSKSHLEDQ
jgi:hypothetical protein